MKFSISIEQYAYRLVKLNSLNSALGETLNNLLNFKGGILSLTMTPEEISLIIRNDIFEEEFGHIEVSGSVSDYRAITVNTVNPGLNETGVLASITKKLADAEVSILTFSTYNYNFILYPQDDHEKMLGLIEKDEDLTRSQS